MFSDLKKKKKETITAKTNIQTVALKRMRY